jgi:two-component system, chemotaxis family, response regulator Rcp1
MTSPQAELVPRASVLLVEDNEDDVLMIKRAMGKGAFVKELRLATNGLEALEYLRSGKGSAGSDHPKPDIILLDLNMDRMNGFELLEILKKDQKLSGIPVIMLTSSDRYQDVERARSLKADGYITKPAKPSGYAETLNEIRRCWLNARQLR